MTHTHISKYYGNNMAPGEWRGSIVPQIQKRPSQPSPVTSRHPLVTSTHQDSSLVSSPNDFPQLAHGCGDCEPQDGWCLPPLETLESGAANGLISTEMKQFASYLLKMVKMTWYKLWEWLNVHLYILYFGLFWMVDVKNGQKRPINCGSIGYPFLSHSHILHTCVGDSWQTRQFVS